MLHIKTTGGFPTLFDDVFMRDLFNRETSDYSLTQTTVPAANIVENDDGYEVEIAVPGMDKSDFKIELDGQTLNVFSEKKAENETAGTGNIVRREFSYQSFSRTFQLAKDVVETEKLEARYENGILRLLIPKKETAKPKPPRLIQIS